jgi:hypothetical protein
MISYNKTWLLNSRLLNEVEKDFKHGLITDTEFTVFKEKYPVGFYTPNLLIRIGLFILTCFVVGFANGLLSLMAMSSGVIESFGWLLFLGLLSYLALELMIREKHHYRSGVDDALLFLSACLFVGSFGMLLLRGYNDMYYVWMSALVFLLTTYLTLRFADMLMALACTASFFAFIFFSWTKIVPGLTTVPFIMMLVSGFTYWLVYAYSKRKEYVIYENCFIVSQIVSLTALYAAGNFYIVQTLSNEMIGQAKPIAFGTIFWLWTIMLPFVYLWFGIKKKDVILLRTGLLLIVVAAITFRTYYHILPLDVTLTIVGAIILGIVYALMKYLKTPKHGFTYKQLDDAHMMDHLKIESLLVAETFANTPTAPANKGVEFGGGDFGGGGSSGGF